MSAQQGVTQPPFCKLTGKSDLILKQGDWSPWSKRAVHLEWVRGLIGWSLLKYLLFVNLLWLLVDKMGSLFWASKVCMWYRRGGLPAAKKIWSINQPLCVHVWWRVKGLGFSYREQLCLRWGKCTCLLNLVENHFVLIYCETTWD